MESLRLQHIAAVSMLSQCTCTQQHAKANPACNIPHMQKAASRGSGSFAHDGHGGHTPDIRRSVGTPGARCIVFRIPKPSHFPTLALPRSGSKGPRRIRLISARKGAP